MKVLKIDEHEKFYEYFDVETVAETEILSRNGEKVTAEIEIFSENVVITRGKIIDGLREGRWSISLIQENQKESMNIKVDYWMG